MRKSAHMTARVFLLLATALTLSGCDQVGQRLGLEDPAKQEREAKAVGSACRHSGRAIEDCYSIYTWLPRAGIFAGWREMDEYMRENKLETIAPQLPPPENPNTKKKKKPAPAPVEGAPAEGEAGKGSEPAKSADKH